MVFAEAPGPYTALRELHKGYGEVYCVNTALVARIRKVNGLKKSDINDAKLTLQTGKDLLAGRLS